MTNIVCLVKDRPNLTYQMLRTLAQNTDSKEFNLTVVDDQSDTPLEEYGWVAKLFPKNGTVLRISPSQHITGKARNLGVWWSERYWGRGEWLYLSDNDVAFKAQWLPVMTRAMLAYRLHGIGHTSRAYFELLGGMRHPYHGVNKLWNVERFEACDVEEVDAVAGYSQIMPWSTWDKFGPLDGNAPGTCQSEDFAFCQRIIADGGRVGYVSPSVVSVCGITNTEGKPATGWETFSREPGLIYE